jgi:hypothetical protein
MLSIINVSGRIEQHPDRLCPIHRKEAFVYNSTGHQKGCIIIGEFVIFEPSDVDKAIRHDHAPMVSHIVLPTAFKYGSIGPDHFALALSFALEEVSIVLGNFELTTLVGGWNRILVVDLALAIWSAIFEYTDELVSVYEYHTTSIVQSAIENTPLVFPIMCEALLYLEKVTILVFNLSVTISLISNELSLVEASI